MNKQLEFAEVAIAPPARAVRMRNAHAMADSAMAKAAERVDRDVPEWIDAALEKVRAFARHSTVGAWTIEMVRGVVERELPDCGDKRVWGHITRAALKAGFIQRKKGWFFPAASSHGSPKCVYERGPNA